MQRNATGMSQLPFSVRALEPSDLIYFLSYCKMKSSTVTVQINFVNNAAEYRLEQKCNRVDKTNAKETPACFCKFSKYLIAATHYPYHPY